MTYSSSSKFALQFPEINKKEKIVETAVMREVMNRTLAIHPGNSVWYGLSRVGKTTTAREMVKKLQEVYSQENPNAFRAVHFEVGEIAAWTGNEQKKGLKSLFNATLGRIDEGLYIQQPPEAIANSLVRGLMKKNIGLILIDEAGNLSLDAIRGMIMVYDAAYNLNHPLSLIFIGMDDLPVKVTQLPQIEGRIHEWCFFEPYKLKDVADLLAQLHPHFAGFDLDNLAQREQVELIYDLYGGFPGLIVPFIKKLEHQQSRNPEPINTKYLKSIHLRTAFDKNLAIGRSREIYKGKPPKQTFYSAKFKNGAKQDAQQNNQKGKNSKGGSNGKGK